VEHAGKPGACARQYRSRRPPKFFAVASCEEIGSSADHIQANRSGQAIQPDLLLRCRIRDYTVCQQYAYMLRPRVRYIPSYARRYAPYSFVHFPQSLRLSVYYVVYLCVIMRCTTYHLSQLRIRTVNVCMEDAFCAKSRVMLGGYWLFILPH
jgi:hypothetical protein